MTQLTAEQRALWVEGMDDPQPTGDQTMDQARAFAIESFRRFCAFDGLPVPSPEAVRAEMDRRVSVAR
jgi:hypothetical protein